MNAKQIILQIALKENKPPEEIEAAMLTAMREAMATEDPLAQKLWKKLAPNGKEPTLDEFLEFCAKRAREKLY